MSIFMPLRYKLTTPRSNPVLVFCGPSTLSPDPLFSLLPLLPHTNPLPCLVILYLSIQKLLLFIALYILILTFYLIDEQDNCVSVLLLLSYSTWCLSHFIASTCLWWLYRETCSMFFLAFQIWNVALLQSLHHNQMTVLFFITLFWEKGPVLHIDERHS